MDIHEYQAKALLADALAASQVPDVSVVVSKP